MFDSFKIELGKLKRAAMRWKSSPLGSFFQTNDMSVMNLRVLCVKSCTSYYYDGSAILVGTTLWASLLLNIALILALIFVAVL